MKKVFGECAPDFLYTPPEYLRLTPRMRGVLRAREAKRRDKRAREYRACGGGII